MKRIITAALAALLAFALCACSSEGKTKPDETKGTETGVPAQFNGETIYLNYERDFVDMRYLENVGGEMRSNTVFNLRDITYSQNGDVTLKITMYCFENKPMEEAMEGAGNMVDKTINGLTFKYFENEVEFTDGKMPGHNYAYTFNGSTYTISFISQYDMTAFEEAFMNNVSFVQP